MKKLWISSFVILICLASILPAWADEPGREEKVHAVQNRIFHSNNEIDFSLGYIADDDFFHVYPIGLGYTWHINDYFSWEVGRVQYMFNQDKDLKETLEDEFEATPEKFPQQKYMWHSHLVYRPLYGKSAWMNSKLVNHEIYFFAGAGQVNYEWEYSTGETETENAWSLSMGAGMRFFLSKHLCLNMDVRNLTNFRDDDTQNNLAFGMSFGYRFNLKPRKLPENPTTQKLKKILDEK